MRLGARARETLEASETEGTMWYNYCSLGSREILKASETLEASGTEGAIENGEAAIETVSVSETGGAIVSFRVS